MYGTIEECEDGRWRLRFTRTLAHPIDTVWRAISDPDHLEAWFPSTIEGDRREGAPLRFSFPRGEAPPFDGKMTAYDPPSLMEFWWGPDLIRIELRPADGGTTLTLLDTLEERGKGARDGAGWHTCIDALAAALDGRENPRDEMSRWNEVHPHYVESFGPEAATIGPPEGMS
jgi:uncharacterized protein YndB with AHSA1/START domain